MNWKSGQVLLLLVHLVEISQGLKCYVCNSAVQAKCGNSAPSKDYIVECTPETALPLTISDHEHSHGKLTANPSSSLSSKIPAGDGKRPLSTKRMENELALETESQLAFTLSRVNYTFCRKTITRIPRQQNHDNIKEADSRIIRSCGWIDEGRPNMCKWSDGAMEIQSEYCVCSGEDECNDGVRIHVSATAIVSLGLVMAIANIF